MSKIYDMGTERWRDWVEKKLDNLIAGDGVSIERLTPTVLKISSSGGIKDIPPATTSTIGGVKVGGGLSVSSDGTLSVSGGGSGQPIGIDTTIPSVPTDDSVPSTKLMVDQVAQLEQGIDAKIATKADQSDLDKVKPSNAGTTGQVLTKTATGQEWKYSDSSSCVGYIIEAKSSIEFDSSFSGMVSFRFFLKRPNIDNSYLYIGLEKAFIRYATNSKNSTAVYVNGVKNDINVYVGNYLDLVITYDSNIISFYINSVLAYTQSNVSIENFGNIVTRQDQGVNQNVYIVQKFDSALSNYDITKIWNGGKVIGMPLPYYFSSNINNTITNTLKKYNNIDGRYGTISSTPTSNGYYNIISVSKGTDSSCTGIDGLSFAAIETSIGSSISGGMLGASEVIIDVKSLKSATKIKFSADHSKILTISSPGLYKISLDRINYNVLFVEVGKEIELLYYYKGINCVANYNQAKDRLALDSIGGKTIPILASFNAQEQGNIISDTIPTDADYIPQLAVVGNDVYIASSLNVFKKITI